MLVALMALFFAVGGASFAADATNSAVRLITGKSVKNSSLTGKDIKNSSLTTSDVKNRSLRAADFKLGQLPAGARGPQGPKGDRAEVIGTDVTGAINGIAGAVPAHSCLTDDADAGGAQVGDLPVMAFVGNTPAPSGLVFQPLKISSPGHMTLRFCNPTDTPSPAFANVGVRIITFR